MPSSWNDRKPARAGYLVCLCLLAQACPAVDGKDVVVGSEDDAVFVGACIGADTDCERSVKTKSLGTSDTLKCEAEPGSDLEVDWLSDVVPTECTDSASDGCQVGDERIAIDTDGGAWVVMNFHSFGDPTSPAERPHGVWLARYAADGTRTAGTTVIEEPPPSAGHTSFQADVAITSTGHAVVTVYSVEAANADVELSEKVLVAEYDKNGKSVRKPITLTGISSTHVAITGDDEIVVASNAANNAHHGVLAGLSSEGALRFSQINLDAYGQGAGAGVSGVGVNDRNRITVLMARKLKADSAEQHLAFSQFDRNGNVIWDRLLDTGDDRSSWVQFGMDGAGNSLMMGFVGGSNEARATDAMLEKVSSSGELVFRMLLPSSIGDQVFTVERGGDNRIFVGTPVRGSVQIFEISADGSRCVQHRLPDDVSYGLTASSDGHLYFLNYGGGGLPTQFGRLKPIPNE